MSGTVDLVFPFIVISFLFLPGMKILFPFLPSVKIIKFTPINHGHVTGFTKFFLPYF